MRGRFARLSVGLVIVAAILGPVLAILPFWIHTWGATAEEVAHAYPGDGLLSNPVIQWTHVALLAGLTVAVRNPMRI